MRIIYPESKWKNATANIGKPGEKSKQDVVVKLGAVRVEMKEDEAIELINNLSDFLDSRNA